MFIGVFSSSLILELFLKSLDTTYTHCFSISFTMPDMEENHILLNTPQLGMVGPGCCQLCLGASQLFYACCCLLVPKLRKGGGGRNVKTH